MATTCFTIQFNRTVIPYNELLRKILEYSVSFHSKRCLYNINYYHRKNLDQPCRNMAFTIPVINSFILYSKARALFIFISGLLNREYRDGLSNLAQSFFSSSFSFLAGDGFWIWLLWIWRPKEAELHRKEMFLRNLLLLKSTSFLLP